MPESRMFVGVDVSKAHLDVGVSGSDEVTRYRNAEAGVAELVEELAERSPELIVMEAIRVHNMQAKEPGGAYG